MDIDGPRPVTECGEASRLVCKRMRLI